MSRRTRQRGIGLGNPVRGAKKALSLLEYDTLDPTDRLAALRRVRTTPRRDDIPLCWSPHGGGEIELICVNPRTNPPTYRIRVRTYRDCAGPIPKTGLP